MPEWSCNWMRREIDQVHGQLGAVAYTDEDRRLINEAADYWQDKCVWYRTKQILKQAYGGQVNHTEIASCGLWDAFALQVPLGQLTLDYEKVLNKGLNGVIAEVEEELARLSAGDSRMPEQEAVSECGSHFP